MGRPPSTGGPVFRFNSAEEVLVRFTGFGPEEDEWVSVMKLVRQRSLSCESSECVAVFQGDLILCFQEGKEQSLYFDAHVLDAQRRRHDMRGCRCRFLVRYDHDLSKEIVPLRKICRRPETEYRLQQLHALNESATNLPKAGPDLRTVNSVRVYPPAEKRQHKLEGHADNTNILLAASHTNIPAKSKSNNQKLKRSPILLWGIQMLILVTLLSNQKWRMWMLGLRDFQMSHLEMLFN